MKLNSLYWLRTLLQRLAIVLLMYGITRLLFLLFNQHLFPSLNLAEYLVVQLRGMRFDFSALLYMNSLLILAHLIPGKWRENARFRTILKLIFYGFNGIALSWEVSDFIYFEFGLKRTSTHVLGMAGDAFALIPTFIRDFWYMAFVGIGFLIFLEFLYRKTGKSKMPKAINLYLEIPVLLLICALSLIGMRGGLQLRPISPGTASMGLKEHRLSPVVLNTTFNMLYSVGHRGLKIPNYMSEEEMIRLAPASLVRSVDSLGKPKQNLLIIIMESFSAEYSAVLNPDLDTGWMPFTDSLMQSGLHFPWAFAAGKRSNEGIAAINLSLPVLMEDPLIGSLYSTNKFSGLGDLFQGAGYSTWFFHGGTNGTMGFDQFLNSIGIQHYVGRKEYDDEQDFDGAWGIFDEPFFQFTAEQLSQAEHPFAAQLFSLSSHHPYTIPDKWKGKLRKGPIPMHEAVSYGDKALEAFFRTIKDEDWFENTLFIITADHTGQVAPGNHRYANAHGTWHIPMILWKADGSLEGEKQQIAGHIDVLPTAASALLSDFEIKAMGRDLIADSIGFSYQHLNNVYQITTDEWLLQLNLSKSASSSQVQALYRYRTDLMLKENLMDEYPELCSELTQKLSAVIQQYHSVLVNNSYQ
ncbi:MAG: phosphoglycerol transferase MdoB-like AlkP superfamily enzyme [Limisphaerales bacterium]